MRTSKNITITDNGNNYNYVLTKMSALNLQKWTARAFAVLIETGILEQEAVSNDFLTNLKAVFSKFSGDTLSHLGRVNCDKLDALVLDLIGKTAERVVGVSKIKVTETDLDSTLENLSSLLELEKECLFINFPMFADVKPSDFQPSDQTEKPTAKQRTLIRPSRS